MTEAPRARIAVKAAWPGRVDEGHRAAVADIHLVGADMLGDATGLAGHHVGLAQGVEQRGLAVVDMAHDRDHGRAGHEVARHVVDALDAFLDVGLADALHPVAELGDDQLGRIGVEDLVDRRQDAVLHQHLDDLGTAHGHAGGQLLHRDRLGQHDLAQRPASVLPMA